MHDDPIAPTPFPSENRMAELEARVLREQRKQGGLPMQPEDNPVINKDPFVDKTPPKQES